MGFQYQLMAASVSTTVLSSVSIAVV